MSDSINTKDYQERVQQIGQMLLDVVASVSLGDLNVEVDIPDDVDVLADLGVGLQFLIEDLRELNNSQAQTRDELEQRVAQRTRELERAMRELQNTQAQMIQKNWQDYAGDGERVGLKRAPEGEAPAKPSDWLPGMDHALTLGQATTAGNGNAEQTLSLPIKLQDEVIGVVGFNRANGKPWARDEVNTVEQIIEQVGLALENQRLFDQTQAALAEMDTLYNASAELNTAQTYDEILTAFQSHAAVERRAQVMTIGLFDTPWTSESRPRVVDLLAVISEGEVDRRNLSLPLNLGAENLITPSEYTFIANMDSDTRVNENLRSYFSERLGVKAAAFFPLVVAGRWVGYINAYYPVPNQFGEGTLRRAMAIASQASVAVQNLRSLELAEQRAEELQQRSDELEQVNRIVSTVAASFDLSASLDFVARELRHAVPRVDEVSIALLNTESNVLDVVADSFRDASRTSMVGESWPVSGNAAVEQVMSTRQSGVLRDVRRLESAAMLREVTDARGYDSMVLFPLIAGNDVIGVVSCAFYQGHEVSGLESDEMRLVETIMLQASTAIQNTRLLDKTQSALTETTSLYQANGELNAVQSTQEVLDVLRNYTALGDAARVITINLFDQPWVGDNPPEGVQRVATWSRMNDFSAEQASLALTEYPHAEQMMPRNDLRVANDFDEYPGLKDVIDQNFPPETFDVQAILMVPLRVAGACIGEVTALYNQPIELSEGQQRRMMALAGQAAVAIQNIRLLEETQKRASQLQTAAEIARESSGTLELSELLDRSVNLITERFGYDHASIFLLEGSNAVVKAATGAAGRTMVDEGYSLPMVEGNSVIGTVTYIGEPIVVNDVAHAPLFHANPQLPDTRSELGIPLKIGNRVTGALDVHSTNLNAFTDDDIAVLEILADQIAVAVDNARSFEVAQQAVDEMREIDRLKSEFLANMSHELRTPLNSIIGFSRVILKGIDGPVNDLQRQDLDAIHNSGQHLLDMINDILDLSRIEAGKMDLSIEELNLNETVNSVMATVKGLIKEKQLRIVNNTPENLPIVSADRTRARQILINLFSNAVKFTEEGTITLDVTVEDVPQPQVRIAVSDTGIGISQEDQEKLFARFSQVDSSPTRKAGGTGLGLNISRSLVELMGGEMGVYSEEGKGSTFYFTLPLVGVVPAAQQQEQGGRLILSIGADEKAIDLYKKFLKPHGYRVVALTDSENVTSQVLQMMPYAITLDITVQDGDGWSILETLTGNPTTRQIPVIVCSILEEQERAEKLGAHTYVAKPMREEDLVKAVVSVQDAQQPRQQRILVIDDDPNVVQLVEKATRRERHMALDYANSGAKGMERLTAKRPDAVILDLFMPDLDGFSFLENMHKDPALKDIPVVVLTGAELTESERRKLEHYQRELLFKNDFLAEDLVGSLQRAMHTGESS